MSYEALFPYLCGNHYFPPEIVKLEHGEVLVDCGAYDGDTILEFIKHLDNLSIHEFDAIYALEPDLENFISLQKLSEKVENLHCLNVGAWNQQAILQFSTEGTMNSAISNIGDSFIEVDSIDNILQGKRTTIIKMDIEGAELSALKGAEQTILNHKPKLAISAYHKANDLITIPQYIKSLVPEYKLYFRVHKPGTVDSVLYAVCDSR